MCMSTTWTAAGGTGWETDGDYGKRGQGPERLYELVLNSFSCSACRLWIMLMTRA